MNNAFEVTPELLAGFLDEAPAYLAALEDGLLAFEQQARDGSVALRDSADHARMNEMFRAAHSLKGIAASLGFQRIRDLTHLMESLFDALRSGKRELDATEVEALFSAVDTLRRLIDELSEPVDPPVSIDEGLALLSRILNRDASEPAAATTPVPSAPSIESEPLTQDRELLARFVESSGEALDALSQHLLALEERPDSDGAIVNEIFRCAHNIKGASGAVGCGPMKHLTHDMESLFDRVRTNTLAIDPALMTALFKAVDFLRTCLTAIQTDCSAALPPAPDLFAPWIDDAPREASAASGSGGLRVRVEFPRSSADAPILACVIYNRLSDLSRSIQSDPDVFALGSDSELSAVTYTLETAEQPGPVERLIRTYSVESVLIEATVAAAEAPAVTPAPPARVADSPAEQRGAEQPAPSAATGAVRDAAPNATTQKAAETIRVDLERLDQLVNLGGELVITKARFSEIARRLATIFDRTNISGLVEDISGRIDGLRRIAREIGGSGATRVAHELSDSALHLSESFGTIRNLLRRLHESRAAMTELGEAVHGLNRISEGMQRRIMQTRMVAIGPLFQRFRRVIRDISKATGKKVELALHGEATELDKRMIDELVDPLTHMVRNSVDHGIEPPDARRAAGKPEAGQIVLDAFHRGRHICIEVRDDGKGLDVARIRRKIVERDLASAAQVEQLSDRDAMQYIFRPGFSTAEQVTDLSGRGMGMDIVRTKIEALNGAVELDSEPGRGTRFTINLPLTLAIIPAMMVRVGSCGYAVPLEMVVEITTVARSQVRQVQAQSVIVLRDHVIPLATLEHLLQMQHPEQRTRGSGQRDSCTVMILGCQNERLGLVVDELLGQEDIVIKDVAANYRNIDGVAGASIMGDGSVSLILDVAALLSNFARRGAAQVVFSAEPDPAAVLCTGARA